MNTLLKKGTIFVLAVAGLMAVNTQAAVIITGVFDADLTGGVPKGIEIYVDGTQDFTGWNVSNYNNGSTTATNTFSLSALGTVVDSFVYLTESTPTEFSDWFGFSANITGISALNVNGDDAIGILNGTTLTDVFGAIGTDGTGELWEYTDGWAYRSDQTGPSTTFNISDWTVAQGDFDTFSSNAAATNSMPIGTYTAVPEPTTFALLSLGLGMLYTIRRKRK